MTRTCCACGRTGNLRRYRAARDLGGPAQWICAYGCEKVER